MIEKEKHKISRRTLVLGGSALGTLALAGGTGTMVYPTSKDKDVALDNSYLSELSLEEKTLQANGVKLYYVRGEGAAGMPELCFLHGTTVNHTIFKKQIEYFRKKGYGILAADLRGDGKSEPKSADEPFYSLENRVADVAALLDKEKARKVNLIGHSMGAIIAAAYAAEKKGVQALALLEGSYDFKKTLTTGAKFFFTFSGMFRSLFTAQNWAAREVFGIPEAYVDFSKLAEVSDADFAKITYERVSPQYVRAMHALSENVMTWNIEDKLDAITVPTLIIGAGKSQFIAPESHAELKERIGGNASIIVYPDAKHQLVLTHAERVSGDLENFMQGCAA